MNCDVLFHPQLLSDLVTSRHEDALLIAYQEPDQTLGDEEMKIKVRRGRVVDIAKTLPCEEADGENVGIGKFGATGARVLIEELNQVLAAGGTRDWLPRAFETFARRRPLHVVETRGFPWTEVDSPEDYWHACADVLPAIVAFEQAGVRPRTGAAPGNSDGRVAHHV